MEIERARVACLKDIAEADLLLDEDLTFLCEHIFAHQPEAVEQLLSGAMPCSISTSHIWGQPWILQSKFRSNFLFPRNTPLMFPPLVFAAHQLHLHSPSCVLNIVNKHHAILGVKPHELGCTRRRLVAASLLCAVGLGVRRATGAWRWAAVTVAAAFLALQRCA
jgi:hypothetical protein